jgi:hypothetical protein
MNPLLEEAIEQVRQLPEPQQDKAAATISRFVKARTDGTKDSADLQTLVKEYERVSSNIRAIER